MSGGEQNDLIAGLPDYDATAEDQAGEVAAASLFAAAVLSPVSGVSLLAAVPNTTNGSNGPAPEPSAPIVKEAESKPKPKSTHTPTPLDSLPIPEGRSLKSDRLRMGLNELHDDHSELPATSFSARGHHADAHGGSGKQLMCPMSGAIAALKVKADADKAAVDNSDAASHKSGGSHRSGVSKKSGSRRSGASGSKKSGSKQSGSKNASTNASSRRRNRKIPTFSEWEADNYIPVIKSSWQTLLESNPKEKIAPWFADKLAELEPTLNAVYLAAGRDNMAKHLWKGLEFIADSVDDPPGLPNKLRVLAPVHLEKGVTQAHIPKFGQALMEMFALFLGKDFDMRVKTAWEWLWTWLSGVFVMVMDEASEEATLVSQSWDIAQENYPQDRFGELIFDILFSLAPNLKQTFAKPRQVLSVKFVEMIATFVTFNGDQATMEEQIVWLGIRHVAYGARHQHVQVFGQVLMNAMERAVGDEWTAEMHKAWMDLWSSTCEAMLSITMEAEKHGEVVRELWRNMQSRTTTQKFGHLLRASLLSGTEWVQTLSVGIQGGLDESLLTKADRDKQRSDEKEKKERRQSLVDKLAQEGDPAEGNIGGSTKDVKKLEEEGEGTDADAIGKKFWEMITELMQVLWEPERMNERIIIMTTRLYALAIRPDNIPTIGKGIGATLKKTMGADWKEEHEEAWTWFWKMASKAMTQVLSCLMRNEGELIRDKWEECKESRPSEEIGELIFQELGRLAPHIVHLFKKPKKIQALQFVSAIDIIVGFNEDPVNFFDQLRPLAIRHIRYGVKADFARSFGKAILRAIKTVLGDKYDEATSKAFDTLWLRVSCCITRALAAGSNLIAVSLINEDIDQLQSAMDGAPRGERFQYLTELNLNGENFSPLYWSIKEGQLEIAKFIIDDLLTIRADRHTYYYGREIMWRKHPDLMVVLCKDMPLLLPNLFDGMLWHARIVTNGFVRVNYYLREMYGDPREIDDPWEGPMGVMVLHGQPENFMHPVVEKLLELKFDRFGRKMYVALQTWYTMILALFTVGHVAHDGTCDPAMLNLRLATLVMGVVTWGVQLALISRQFYTGQYQRVRALPFLHLLVPRFLSSPWNIARFISLAMLIAASASEPCWFPETVPEIAPDAVLPAVANAAVVPVVTWRYVLIACTGFLLWAQLTQVLIISAKFAALVYTIGCIIPEIGRNLLVTCVLMLSFAAAFTSLRIDEYGDPAQAMLNLTQIILGIAPENAYLIDRSWGVAFLIGLLLVVQLGMLNILIAQLSLAYANLVKNEKAFAMLNRAYICVEMESFLSREQRMRFYDELGFDSPLEFDKGDEGPPGGIQTPMPASIRVDDKYIPDRVLRFTGEASPMDPWPSNRAENQEDLSLVDNDKEEGAV